MSGFRDMCNTEMYVSLIGMIRQAAEETRNDIKNHISNENIRLTHILFEHQRKLMEIEKRQTTLEVMQRDLDQQLRKNTIIIYGLEVPGEMELMKFTLDKLQELLGVILIKSDINNIYLTQMDTVTAIKIELTRYVKKILILRKARKLNRTDIRITDEILCEQTRRLTINDEELPSTSNAGGAATANQPLNNITVPQAKKVRVEDATMLQSTSLGHPHLYRQVAVAPHVSQERTKRPSTTNIQKSNA